MNNRYLNRELSWLEFNQRVLDEAISSHTPLLERLKFLAISASNLDEFFRVRFGGLQMLADSGSGKVDQSGLTAREQVMAISDRVIGMVADQQQCFLQSIEPQLEQEGICRKDSTELADVQLSFINGEFAEEATSLLAPIGVGVDTHWPHLANLSLQLCVRLKMNENGDGTLLTGPAKDESSEIQERFAIIPIGNALPRIVRLPGERDYHYILVEDAVQLFVERFFPGQEVIECVPFRITRNADLSVREDSAADLMQGMTEVLDARKDSPCIRLELSARTSSETKQFLSEQFQVNEHQVFANDGPLELSAYFRLADAQGFEHLKFERWQPQPSPDIDPSDSIFDNIQKRDQLLFHPYESFDPVVRFLKEASSDPDVLSIKQTLYRTSRNSPIVSALAKAAENGKNVTVLVELKARFDEERNIEGAKLLEQSGAHVIYGVRGFKTHAKLSVVVRRGPNGLERYVHFGTGNYNEATARIYSDISLMTTDEDLGQDAIAFFNSICGFSQPQAMSKLEAAPTSLRNKLIELIDIEIEIVKRGKSGLIQAKLNSLVDKKLIDKLYEASSAGVKIELNIRGICCLRPGIEGLSENIRVFSIVDRFLEHARIFCFHHDGDPRVFISSADWMERNLDRRLELLVPIEDPRLAKRLIKFLACFANDDVKARNLNSDGSYSLPEKAEADDGCRSQEELYRWACDNVKQLQRDKTTEFQPHSRSDVTELDES